MERYKVITGFIPSGRTLELLERLREEHGVNSLFAHHAREVTLESSVARAGIADESDVVTLLVEEARAETVFEFVYGFVTAGDRDGGMVFLERTVAARPLLLPPV